MLMTMPCCSDQQYISDVKTSCISARVKWPRGNTMWTMDAPVPPSFQKGYEKLLRDKSGPASYRVQAVARTKPQMKVKNMFLRAQNREFEGMTEKDESIWKGDYQFICMGDTQLGMGDQKTEEEFSRIAVEFINQRKGHIKFVVICGDHTHNLEDIWSKGDIKLGRRKRIQELDAYKKIYSKLDEDIPLVCVCGNHDVGNKPTNKTIQLYSEEFGDDYHSFWSGGVKFCVLNSQIIQGLEDSNELSQAHEKWADQVFEQKHENEPIHVVAMCHVPPFCWDVEENDTNFNWHKKKRKLWLDKMVKANVKKVYCAHYHRRAGGKYKGLEVVVTGALGTHIRTNEVPEKFQRSKLDEINFKLSKDGFGGIEANEETSGLHVVHVSKEGLDEEWLSIAQISEEVWGKKNINQTKGEGKSGLGHSRF